MKVMVVEFKVSSIVCRPNVLIGNNQLMIIHVMFVQDEVYCVVMASRSINPSVSLS